MHEKDLLRYKCDNLNFISAKEGTLIEIYPNKTLICSQFIKIDWDSDNILKFSSFLCSIIESKHIQVEYTISLQINNSDEIDIDFNIYKNESYMTTEIKFISRDKNGKYITFKKDDIVLIKIYGSSIYGGQNKIITSPKLLNSEFDIYIK
jgi:hypothetical protein